MAHQDQPLSLASIPSASDFILLSDHESSTPSSFFGEKPVLYSGISECDLLISDEAMKKWEVFAKLFGNITNGLGTEQGQAPSDIEAATSSGLDTMKVLCGVSGYVTSSSVILFHKLNQHSGEIPDEPKSHPRVISIPYPCISIHATQRLYRTVLNGNAQHSYSALPSSESGVDPNGTETGAVYMQLDMDPSAREQGNAGNDDDENADERTVEILLVPQSDLLQQTNGGQEPSSGSNQDVNDSKVKEIFEALSKCADLHPDPSFENEEGGGGLASMFGFGSGGMPGDGGWITAENAHEFEGQFGDHPDEEDEGIEQDEDETGLGPGAGIRRPRQEAGEHNTEATDTRNGDSGDGNEETKWQRTG